MASDVTLKEKRLAAKRKLAEIKLARMQQEQEQPGDSIGQQLIGRAQEANKLKQMRQAGEITRPEEIIRSAGQGAGAIMDVGGAALETADNFLLNAPSTVIKGAASMAGALPIPMDERNLGQYTTDQIESGMEQYSKFKQERPRAAGVIEGLGNIASVATTPFTKQPIKKAGQTIYQSGVKKSDDAILSIIQPQQNKAARVAAQKQGKLVSGINDTVKASDVEKRALDVIKRDDVFGKVLPRSLSKKETLARQKAIEISQKLQKDLGQYNNFKLKPEPLKRNLLGKIESDLMDDPTIWTSSGDPKTLVQNYIKKANDIIDSNPNTLQGLMKSRIEFDQWVQSKTPNVFNPGAETVNRAATKSVRNSINDFIDKTIPSGAVKERLSDSSALFTAADNMADKVGSLSPTMLGRAVQAVENKIPFKSELAKLGFLTGVGAASTVAPQIAISGGVVYLGGKALTSSQSRKLIGAALRHGSDVLDIGTKEALQDYLKELQAQEEDELRLPAKSVIFKNNEGR